VHHSAIPSFKDDLPYVVAAIELDGTDERVNMMSNVVGYPWEDVKVGMRVRVVFTDVSTEATLPQFQPDEEARRGEERI
jgi:uncharacterized OB-fold protein